MIRADKAHHIMKLHESDYDNFLDKLKAKRKVKKDEAHKKKAEAEAKKAESLKADKTLAEAEAYKKTHLKEKATALIEGAGGIEGIKSTVTNVMDYIKPSETKSDYEVGIGKDGDKKPEELILGMPPIAVYVGGAVLVLAAIYGISRIMKAPAQQQQIFANPGSPVQPYLQNAA